MEILDWLVALIPVFSFGFIPIVGSMIGGKAVQQSMGIAIGSFVFALIMLLVRRPELTPHIFIVSFLSGAFWAIGSMGQFLGINYLGVARSTPILNGGQIIGTSIVGVMLGDWASSEVKMFGFSALAFIIAGIVFTSYTQNKSKDRSGMMKGMLISALGALSFTAYIGILKYYSIDGWSSIFPQSIGQVVTLIIVSLAVFRIRPFGKMAFANSVVGIIWAVGNIALLVSQVKLGLATAYPISQAAVIVSVIGGVLINKERKTHKEWIMTCIGIAVICIGLFLIYLSGKH